MKLRKRILSSVSALAILASPSTLGYSTVGAIGEEDILEERIPTIKSDLVVIPDDSWLNTVDGWQINCDPQVKLYYELSVDEFGVPKEMPAELIEWNGGINLEEGEYNIRFWADLGTEETEPVYCDEHYKLDTSLPVEFSLVAKKEERNSNAVTVNISIIDDEFSGVKDVYYTLNNDNNHLNFDASSNQFVLYDFKNNDVVTVYVVDNADNIQKKSIIASEIKDVSAPDLKVNIPAGQWLSDTNGWVSAEGATIYYEITDEDFDEPTNTLPEGAVEWNNGESVLEGEHKIRFWAVYPNDPERRKAVSNVHTYMLDKTDPLNFGIYSEINEVNQYYRELVVSNINAITDNYSGIETVFYTIDEGKDVAFDKLDRKFDGIQLERDKANNIIGFTITLKESLKDAVIRVYVVDKTGHYNSAVSELNFESSSPEITSISAVRSDKHSKLDSNKTWNGYENVRQYIANEESLLKIGVRDDFMPQSPVTLYLIINGKEKKFDADKYRDLNAENGIYYMYIPFEELGLTTRKQYDIEVYALDGTESENFEVSTTKLDSLVYYASSNYDFNLTYAGRYVFDTSDEYVDELKSKYQACYNDLEDSSVIFDISDDNVIKNYEIQIDGQVTTSVDLSKGEIVTETVAVTDNEGQPVTNEDGETETTVVEKWLHVTSKTVPVDLEELNDGEHKIILKVTNFAGNTYEQSVDILIDTTKPGIKGNSFESINIESQASLLKYLSFGIFGNEEISLIIDVSDNQNNVVSSGIKSVTLNWCGEDKDATLIDGKYVFSGLKPKKNGIPTITITDYMENSSIYNIISPIDKEDSSAGSVSVSLEDGKVSLMLEQDRPGVSIGLPSYDYIGENQALWYKGDIEYTVDAWDDQKSSSFYSGLNKVDVKLEKEGNESPVYEFTENQVAGIKFTNQKVDGSVTFSKSTTSENYYSVTGDGHFTIIAQSFDNAYNESDEAKRTIHIDSTNPEILNFIFDDSISSADVTDNALYKYDSVEIKPYGYYFREKTQLKVVVADLNVSSGFKEVTLWLDGVEGSNSGEVTHPVIVDKNGFAYAIFEIESNFKGRVIAEVIDNVGHSSGQISADGDIVEDSILHGNTSSLKIEEDVSTDKKDAKQLPLYNRSIPLTITASDSFSGISSIEWVIENDNKSGIIKIDNGRVVSQEGTEASSITTITEDNNLITSLKFSIVVESNTNENNVTVKLTDRSGNTSEESRVYSIDTTVPTISATFANTSVQNGSYYNANQTVNIAITERNFNGGDVQVKLNGNDQQVSWDNDGSEVGTDSTVHNASFSIGADGDYIYEISYTDRAGNEATSVVSQQFTIDLTDPQANISFDTGDPNLNDAFYNKDRTVTFNINEHNYSSATIKITKDGKDVSENYDLENWSPKDHSGDNHTQSIVLSENGYYVVSISVTDKSGRTVSEQSNGFYIDQDAPNVNIEIENVANGAPSNADTITPVISVNDKEGNLDPETITLSITAIKLNENNELIPDIKKYIGLDEWSTSEIGDIVLDNEFTPNSVVLTLNNLLDDGIYTFEVTASDKAGNTGGISDEEKNSGSKYKISVNRLGSTYEVDSIIAEVEPELRYYRNKEDTLFSFSITEYNVTKLNSSESIVKMTCDGNIVENDIVAIEDTGADKWSKYTYEFPSDIMSKSGKYIVKLYSVDEAGNENPLEINGEDERATVTFFIDNDDPTVAFRDADDKTEFENSSNYRTDSKNIEVEVYDNSQQEAKNVKFMLEGQDITANVQHEAGTMIYLLNIPSKSSAQSLSVYLEDIAGNHTESGVDNFLITTNLFALWFSNTPLFVGSIIAFILAAAGIVFGILRKRTKRYAKF